MITFAITGNIATGKSTVTKTISEKYGIPIVDVDLIIRQVVEPGKPGLQYLVNALGSGILKDDGYLNRAYISNLVFNDKLSMNKLNAIMDPLVKEEVFNQVQDLHSQGHYLVGVDYPLLFESGVNNLYYPIIVISCSPELQLKRLMARNNFTKEQALVRIDSQMSLQDKMAKSDFVIHNNNGLSELSSDIHSIVNKLKQL
jgi:dephospho-CoA kinase